MAVSENIQLHVLFTLPQTLADRAAVIQVVVNRKHDCLLGRTMHLGQHAS